MSNNRKWPTELIVDDAGYYVRRLAWIKSAERRVVKAEMIWDHLVLTFTKT